jgi:hypothetical protein
MGVVSKLTELAKVQLTFTAAVPAKASVQTTMANPSQRASGLTAEQLLNELKKAQRSAS